jgi:invasion protein IalB
MHKLSLYLTAMAMLTLPATAQETQDPQIHGMTPGGHGRHMHRDWSTPGQHKHNACWHNHHGKWVWVCR